MSARLPELLLLDRMPTPIGTMLLVTDDEGKLRALDWDDYEERLRRVMQRYYGKSADLRDGTAPEAVRAPLTAYFSGALQAIRSIRTASAGTAFQHQVWAALREIPAGTTLSYGALAKRIGRATAVRAVGHANGDNPICLVVPCHRVIGSDGSLTGYGGGLERKRWLLAHEGVAVAEAPEGKRLAV